MNKKTRLIISLLVFLLMQRRTTLTLLFVLWFPGLAGASPLSVPSWFIADASDPYAIFSAWKNLSTREAAVYLGAEWNVLGGQLVDEQGNPLALTRLSGSYADGIRGHVVDLVTDKDGYFLIYGPQYLDVDESATDSLKLRSWRFHVAPGYPLSPKGALYAAEKKDIKTAGAQLVLKQEDRAFYVLTVDRHNSFNQQEFDSFRAEASQLGPTVVARPFRDKPRPREGSTENRKRTAYKLKILSAGGRAAAHAILKYQAYDGYEGNYQIVETDEEGQCEVVECLLANKDKAYYADIQRQITVDAPTIVGPVSFSLDKDHLNIITLAQPAKVSGRLTNQRGDPIGMRLSISYKRANLIAFELDMPLATDGTFSCDRIMPGEEFRVIAGGVSRQSTPRAPTASDYLSLAPGEERIVNLQVPLPAALRVLVVNQREQPVNGEVMLRSEEDAQLSNVQKSVGKFGFWALGPEPFRISIQAAGFDDYRSDPIQLEPGELRFVKIVLTPKPSG
jgi:hypothetical protein